MQALPALVEGLKKKRVTAGIVEVVGEADSKVVNKVTGLESQVDIIAVVAGVRVRGFSEDIFKVDICSMLTSISYSDDSDYSTGKSIGWMNYCYVSILFWLFLILS